jgi:hypothetical protein
VKLSVALNMGAFEILFIILGLLLFRKQKRINYLQKNEHFGIYRNYISIIGHIFCMLLSNLSSEI